MYPIFTLKRRVFRQGLQTAILALVISAQILGLCPEALAAFDGNAPQVLDHSEIDRLFEAYISQNGLEESLISVAYVYTGTGEAWYHREDQWYYSASLYKVPLMMLFAEKEYEGVLQADSEINGIPLATLEEEVLTFSNNDLAYSAMLYLAQPDVCRGMFRKFAMLPEDYYSWDFYGGSYFTAHFVSDVLTRLYQEPERFPHVIECLKQAQPEHYFKLKLGTDYEIAQKYGNYYDEDERDWNHTAGIIFTPTPFILTVMTGYGGISETIIADLAVLFRDYTLLADQRLQALDAAVAEAASPAPGDANGTVEEAGSDGLINDPGNVQGLNASEYDFSGETETVREDAVSSARPMLLTVCVTLWIVLVAIRILILKNAAGKNTKK